MTDTELVREVAEKVMEWKEVTSPVNTIDGGIAQFHVGWDEFRTVCGECANFTPLTNLNHAFMVVERLRDTGHEIIITTPVTANFLWEVEIDENTFRHENLGHAISLAALKALEEK